LPNFNRSYSELKQLIIKIQNSYDYSNYDANEKYLVNFFIGILFFGLELDDSLLRFRSNRYFLDSIFLTILPSRKWVDDNLALFCKKRSMSEKNFFQLINNYLDTYTYNQLALTDNDNKPIKVDFDFLDKFGYIVIPNIITNSLCDELKGIILDILGKEKRDNSLYTYGSGSMFRIYHLISKHKIFQSLLEHKVVHHLMSHFFKRDTFHDKYYLTSFHANILSKNSEEQIWHIDANVPDPIPPWTIRANSNYVIEDLDEHNGSTQMIPGSHFFCRKPSFHEAEDASKYDIKSMSASKGSIIFWHGHLWHRSGCNKSDKLRIALLGAYSSSVFREVCMEENPYLVMNEKNIISQDVRRIIGWDHGYKNKI